MLTRVAAERSLISSRTGSPLPHDASSVVPVISCICSTSVAASRRFTSSFAVAGKLVVAGYHRVPTTAAARLGIPESTAYYWLRRRGRQPIALVAVKPPPWARPTAAPGFARLVPATAASPVITVRVGDAAIIVAPDFTPSCCARARGHGPPHHPMRLQRAHLSRAAHCQPICNEAASAQPIYCQPICNEPCLRACNATQPVSAAVAAVAEIPVPCSGRCAATLCGTLSCAARATLVGHRPMA